MTFMIIIGIIIIAVIIISSGTTVPYEEGMNFKHGYQNPEMLCPHCNTKGLMRTKQVDTKKGISGAKATGAIITGGLSILATGLSRKEKNTQAYCGNCCNTWML